MSGTIDLSEFGSVHLENLDKAQWVTAQKAVRTRNWSASRATESIVILRCGYTSNMMANPIFGPACKRDIDQRCRYRYSVTVPCLLCEVKPRAPDVRQKRRVRDVCSVAAIDILSQSRACSVRYNLELPMWPLPRLRRAGVWDVFVRGKIKLVVPADRFSCLSRSTTMLPCRNMGRRSMPVDCAPIQRSGVPGIRDLHVHEQGEVRSCVLARISLENRPSRHELRVDGRPHLLRLLHCGRGRALLLVACLHVEGALRFM